MWSFRRLWKPAVGVVVMVALTGIAAYVLAARDLDPNHSSLAAATLPPLIPVRDFYANTSAEWAYAPSQDGSMIAWYGVDWTKTVLRVKRTSEAGPFLTLSGAEFHSFRWHPYKNALIVFMEGRLWQIDPLKPSREDWIDITPRGFLNWNIVSSAVGEDDRLVVASNDRNPALPDLYTVRQDGGGKELLEKNEGKTIDWWLRRENVPLIRADRLDNDGTRFLIRDGENEPWRTLTDISARDVFNILYAPRPGTPIYALSDRDGIASRSLQSIPRAGRRLSLPITRKWT